MGYSIRWTHVAATALAAACVSYQTAVIWESLDTVSNVTRIGVPLATVSVALLPVLAESAWRGGERLKSGLMLLPVAILLAYVLPSGTSRLGEAQQQRRITAEQAQIDQAKLRADFLEAQKLAREADVEAARECKSGLGTKCKGAQATLAQRQAAAKDLAARVEQIRPVAQTLLPDWHPAMLPIGLELAAWVALFFGLGPLTHSKTVSVPTAANFNHPVPPTPPRGRDEDVIDWVREFRQRNGRDPQIPELQRQFQGTPKTTAWRRIKAA